MNVTTNNCQKVIEAQLCSLPCGWKTQIASAICNAFSGFTIDCADVKACETLTSLSEFTNIGNQLCITYTDEHGVNNERCFNLDQTQVVITADNGLTKDTPINVQLGGTLIHTTTNHTGSFVHNFTGGTIYEYPYNFQHLQKFSNGTAITSFRGNGSIEPTAPDFSNTVRIGFNYTSSIYELSPDVIPGYMNDKIGYWLGVNAQGHGSFGIYTDDSNSKTGGVFFHTLDSSYTDMLTIFGKHPTTVDGNISITNGGTGFEDYRIATFHDDGAITFWKYGVGTFLDTPTYILGVTADHRVIETTVGDNGIVITADNGLSKDTPTNVQLGSASLTGAPLLHDSYISADFNLSLNDGTFTVGTTAPLLGSKITAQTTDVADYFSIIGIKQNNVTGTSGAGIGVEGQYIITGGTNYSGDGPLGGLYGELAFLGSGSWTFSGSRFAQLGGLSGVTTIYTNSASNYSAGASIFSGGQYFLNAAGSGNIDKFTALRALYPQITPGLAFTGTITNCYGLFVDDYSFSTIASTITNKYGVYQEGLGDKNVFFGHTAFGANVTSGTRVDVVDTANKTANNTTVTISKSGTDTSNNVTTTALSISNTQAANGFFSNCNNYGIDVSVSGSNSPDSIIGIRAIATGGFLTSTGILGTGGYIGVSGTSFGSVNSDGVTGVGSSAGVHGNDNAAGRIGVFGESTMNGDGDNSMALLGYTHAPASGAQVEPLTLMHSGGNTGFASDGAGVAIAFRMPTTATLIPSNPIGKGPLSNKIRSNWTSATDGAQKSELTISGVTGITEVDIAIFYSDGSWRINPITATAASAITPSEGRMVFVQTTNGTFTSVGFWGYQGGSWIKM